MSWERLHLRWFASVALMALLLPGVLGACSAGGIGGSDNGKPTAVTSFYPLYFFTAAIAGDRMEVRNLVPAGAEPHDWEPRPKDTAAIKNAQVFVYNGAGFEGWVDGVLDAARSKQRVDVEVTNGLQLLDTPEHDEHEGESGHEEETEHDPHVWLDPVLAKQIAATIAAGLIQADPDGRSVYERNLATLQDRLDTLHKTFESGLANCERREIFTSHAAFEYLAKRYGLEQIAVQGLAPDAEPTPARIAEVSRDAKARGVTHIFFETLVSPRVAETIAREVGAWTLVLDPLEGLQEDEGKKEDYFTVMEGNLANLRTALGCR